MKHQSGRRPSLLVLFLCLLASSSLTARAGAQPSENLIRSVRMNDVSASTLEVVVDYFYTGGRGTTDVFIHAEPVEADGSIDPRTFDSEEKPLRVGENAETFVIVGKEAFTSTDISVCMSTLDDAILCTELPHRKTWSAAIEKSTDESEIAESAKPTITFLNATAHRIALGGSVDVSWATENAEIVLLGEPDSTSPVLLWRAQSVPREGSLAVAPTVTTTYVLQAEQGNQRVRREVVVEVVPPMEFSFDSPARVCPARAYTLRWRTRHATNVTLNGRSVPAEGTLTVRDHRGGRARYTLMASNEFESLEAEREVRVVPCPLGD